MSSVAEIRKHISYKKLEDVIQLPGEGTWEVYTDRWWSHEPDKGLIFYRKSPQCNRNRSIAETVTRKCHPGAEVIFVPRVYLKHDCSDYR